MLKSTEHSLDNAPLFGASTAPTDPPRKICIQSLDELMEKVEPIVLSEVVDLLVSS
jgi:hypothetical protein